MKLYNILIADDEKEIIQLLKLYLEKDGMNVLVAYDGETAFHLLSQNKVDLAIIDIMMPVIDGFNLLKKIRENNNIPVMILSARTEDACKILGLDLGADDYITKPFNPLEVAARVKANIRRFYDLNSIQNKVNEICIRNLKLDTEQCVVFRDGNPVELTSTEYKVLNLLMSYPGRVFTKQQIYNIGWGEQYIADDNNVMVCISKIRSKIGEEHIKTIRGLGYRLER